VKSHFGITSRGNFEGKNIPNVAVDPAVTASRNGLDAEELHERIEAATTKLYAERTRRVWPGRDEKILASWNGLMLRGVATAARVFGDWEVLRLAVANGEFLHREMVRDGRVMRSHKSGETRIPGFLEDYAAVALGFIALYEATFDDVWIARAQSITESMIRWFWDESTGAFFDTASDAERLITRPRDITDNAMPSGTSMAADLLLHLADLTNDTAMRDRGMTILRGAAQLLTQFSTGFGHLLGVADMAVYGAVEVAIAGERARKEFTLLEREVASHYVPSLVLAGGEPENGERIALLTGRTQRGGLPTAYVCRAYTCDEPVTETARLAEQLEAAGRATPTVSTEV
jgi:uncharacterized protein YyaL (SSP411 family)